MLLHVAAGGDGTMQRQDIECILETALPSILQRVRYISIFDSLVLMVTIDGANGTATS